MAKPSASLAPYLTPRAVVTAIAALFLVVTALGGGSSRPDVAALTLVRLAATALIAALLLATPWERLAPAGRSLRLAGVAALLVAVQLVPLPPSLWAALPGRARYAADAIAGVGSLWRPFTLTPDLTINALLAFLPPVAVALWALTGAAQERRAALYAVGGVALASALLGLIQLGAGPESPLRPYPFTNRDSAVGLLANRNHQAVLLALAIPAVALWAGLSGRATREDGFVRSWISLAAGIFLLAMATATGSRGGLVLAALASVLALLLFRQLQRGWPAPRRGTTVHPAAKWLPIGAAAVVLALAALLARSVAVERLLATDPVDEQRAQWLKPLAEMFWTFFPAGAGFGSFDSIFRGFEPFEMLQVTYLNAAHNDLYQIAIEGGLPALLVLALFLLWWGARTLAAWRSPLDGSPVAYARVASIMTGVVLIGSLFDYPLRTPIHGAIFALGCVWLGLPGRETAETPLPHSRD